MRCSKEEADLRRRKSGETAQVSTVLAFPETVMTGFLDGPYLAGSMQSSRKYRASHVSDLRCVNVR